MKTSRALAFASASLCVVFISARSGPAAAAPAQDKPSPQVAPKAGPMSLEEMERSLFEAVNRERAAEVLEALNGVRARRKAAALALDETLSREAQDISRRYGKSLAGQAQPSGRALSVLYETAKLGQVPSMLHGHVAGTAYRKAGISVRQAGSGTGVNVNFIVVILLDD